MAAIDKVKIIVVGDSGNIGEKYIILYCIIFFFQNIDICKYILFKRIKLLKLYSNYCNTNFL